MKSPLRDEKKQRCSQYAEAVQAAPLDRCTRQGFKAEDRKQGP